MPSKLNSGRLKFSRKITLVNNQKCLVNSCFVGTKIFGLNTGGDIENFFSPAKGNEQHETFSISLRT